MNGCKDGSFPHFWKPCWSSTNLTILTIHGPRITLFGPAIIWYFRQQKWVESYRYSCVASVYRIYFPILLVHLINTQNCGKIAFKHGSSDSHIHRSFLESRNRSINIHGTRYWLHYLYMSSNGNDKPTRRLQKSNVEVKYLYLKRWPLHL